MFYHFPTIQICQHIVLEFTQKEKLLHLSLIPLLFINRFELNVVFVPRNCYNLLFNESFSYRRNKNLWKMFITIF